MADTSGTYGDAAADARALRRGGNLVAVPLFALILVAFFGWTNPLWLPSAELQEFVTLRRSELLLGFGAFGALSGWQMGGRRGGGLLRRLAQKSFAAAFVALAGALCATSFTGIGLPYLGSYAMTTEPAAVEVTVVEMGQRIRRRACDYTAHVTRSDGTGARATICGIPPSLWESLVPGDRLVLSGPGTRFGLRYDTIRPAP